MTYNILIDVYGKSGAWQEAVKVLDALQAQVSPDTGAAADVEKLYKDHLCLHMGKPLLGSACS